MRRRQRKEPVKPPSHTVPAVRTALLLLLLPPAQQRQGCSEAWEVGPRWLPHLGQAAAPNEEERMVTYLPKVLLWEAGSRGGCLDGRNLLSAPQERVQARAPSAPRHGHGCAWGSRDTAPSTGQVLALAAGLENEQWEGCLWDSRWFNSPCEGRISTGSFLLGVWHRESQEHAFPD